MYSIIYADPCWEYAGQQMNIKGTVTSSAEHHYPTLPVSKLKTLDVKSISEPNALLFMWTSSPHLDQAIELMTAWGFQYKTVAFVWDKQKVNPGYYTMSQCELCLVGKRGSIPKPRGARNERQFLSAMRGRHSEKPEEVRARIERMFPTQRKVELFSRTSAEGWDAWGNECPNSIEIPWLESK